MLAISGLSRGFDTCCLRFKSGVAITHAKLASGWLARLYREGVEPSGSLQKVSDHILVPQSLLQNYWAILNGWRVEALCEGGRTRRDLVLAHRQFLGEFEGMLGALPGNLIVAAAAAGSGIR